MKKLSAIFLALMMMLILNVCAAETVTDIEQSLQKIRNHEETEFTISTLTYGPLSTDAVDGAEYAAHLLDHARFEQVDVAQWPDGENLVLSFPKENLFYLFFHANEELIGEERDGKLSLFRAVLDQPGISALSIMQQWYDAMASVLQPSEDWIPDVDATGEIVDGSYFFRVKIREGDPGTWEADDLSQDDSVVRVGEIKTENNLYEVRYDPVADGEINVGVRHFTEGVCDEIHEFVLRVKNGQIVEVPSGSYAASPGDGELDPFISGEWAEVDTQFTRMTVKRNEGRGWNLEIVSPLTHGAYVFKANIGYDCDLEGFVYSDGTFYNVPITAEENPELGDPVTKDVSGILRFEGVDEGNAEDMQISWYHSQKPDETIVFERLPKEAK